MLVSGLVSVAFRNLHLDEVVALVVEAQLSSIEWGGDVHVPQGNLTLARDARRRCIDAGIQVSAYGSYYRAGSHQDSFKAILETAAELGTDTVRVWAIKLSSS